MNMMANMTENKLSGAWFYFSVQYFSIWNCHLELLRTVITTNMK